MGKLTHTVSGSIASFKSADQAPINSLKVHFFPIQSGSGDPSPSNIRPIIGWNRLDIYKTGKNIANFTSLEQGAYDINNGGVPVNGSKTIRTTDYVLLKKGMRCTINASGVNAIMLVIYNMDKNYIGSSGSWADLPQTVTITQDVYIRALFSKFDNGVRIPITPDIASEIQISIDGSNNLYNSYYGDTIPIIFPPTGKNKLDINVPESNDPLELNHKCIGYFFRPDRQYWIDGNSYLSNISIQDNSFSYTTGQANAYGISYCLHLIPEKTYTVSGITSNGQASIFFFNNNKEMTGYQTQMSLSGTNFTVPINTYYTFISFNPSSSNVTASFSNLQVEEGSSVTDYEIPDNTLYGGYIDLITGNIYKRYDKVIIDGSQTITEYYSSSTYGIKSFSITKKNLYPNVPPLGNVYLYCDSLPKDGNTGAAISADTQLWTYWVMAGSYRFVFTASSTYTTTTIAEYLSEHPITLVYQCDETLIGTLTPQQLQTLKDQNNIWSNTNGDIECTYEFTDHMAKRRLELNTPHIETVSQIGAVQFNTDLIAPLKEKTIEFYPQQSGSGDASPTNIRDISSINYLTYYQNNSNLFDINNADIRENSILDDSGIPKSSSYYFYLANKYPTNGARCIYIGNMICQAYRAYFFDINENFLEKSSYYSSTGKSVPGTTIFTPENCGYFSVQIFNNTDISDLYLAVGDATSLKLSDFGNIYGGYVDVINGKIVSEWGYDDLGNYDWWNGNSSGLAQIRSQPSNVKWWDTEYDANKVPCLFIDSIKVVSRDDFVNIIQSNTDDVAMINYKNVPYIASPNLVNTTDAQVKAYVTGKKFVYKLNTPIEYSITPKIIKSIKGENNYHVFPRDSKIEIKYWTH